MQLAARERGFAALLDLDQSKGINMKNVLMRLWKEEEGQDLTEYALLLALISVVMVATINTLAGAIQTAMGKASTALT
jgi:Flp pilus assembly pilin Flp